MRRITSNPVRHKTAVLLDHHPLLLHGLEAVLSRVGVDVVATTDTADDLIELVREHEPDVLIAEPQTPEGGASVLRALEEALETQPKLKVVVLSTSSTEADIAAAFSAGVDAYITKT